MTLLERIDRDFVEAMKQKEEGRLSTLRMARAALKNRQIDTGRALTEQEASAVLKTMIKQYQDAFGDFERGGRDDLMEKQRREIDVLMSYLPPEISEDELRAMVKQALEASGATDFGKAMGVVMKAVDGRADGGRVREIVQSILSRT